MTRTNFITKLMQILRIPAHTKGYTYIREAVEMCVANGDYLNRLTKSLYPAVAEMFGTTSSRVERAIRHSMTLSTQNGGLEAFNNYVGVPIFGVKNKPVNGEVLSILTDMVLHNMPEDPVSNVRSFNIAIPGCPAHNTMCRFLTDRLCVRPEPTLYWA
jgi:hypothetical protein